MPKSKPTHLLLVGYPEEYHVGAHLLRAAQEIALPTTFANAADAFRGNRLVKTFCWRFLGKRPQRLNRFSVDLAEKCRREEITHLIVTGIGPISGQILKELGVLGIQRICYLTDDPWNRNHWAPWFMQALPHYDIVFTPRSSNIEDLKGWGCKSVRYLPFAYDRCHLIASTESLSESEIDLVFVGGGDSDRYPFAVRLQNMGINLALYGAGWQTFPDLKKSWKGKAGVDKIREVTGTAKITLCLVRRANRDGHVMRTYEAAASGACMLVEDTDEHRLVFGPDGECVRYFSTLDEMEQGVRYLLAHSEVRQALRRAAFKKITSGNHSYRDRLLTMLEP